MDMKFTETDQIVLFCFDVESIGLHGEGFAVAGGTYDRNGAIDEFCFACSRVSAAGSDDDRKWVAQNVPNIEENRMDPKAIRDAFWDKWITAKSGFNAKAIADCNWPVESRFLLQCIDDDPSNRKWEGPYPLLDVGSLIIAHGGDPLQEFDRIEGETNKHHPLDDARQ